MTLSERLNKIIDEQELSKAEFSRRIGVSVNYIYQLTGSSDKRPTTIHPSLAKLIALEFGYDETWILHGQTVE